jgi:putative transposase
MTPRQAYPTDLTDKAWSLSQPLVPKAKTGGRPEAYPTREILDAIFSWARRGGSWRMLPHDLPPWRIVYDYFWQWRRDRTWHVRHDLLRGDGRVAAGKRRQPNAGVIDSQSVKTTETGGSAASTPTNRSKAANGISSSIRLD